MQFKIFNQTTQKTYTLKNGENLLQLVRNEHLDVHAPCGGKGTCKKCKLEIDGLGTVLACKTTVDPELWQKAGLKPDQPLVIHAAEQGQSQIVTHHDAVIEGLDPLIRRMVVAVATGTLHDPRPDDVRFQDASGLTMPRNLLNDLSRRLRAGQTTLTVDYQIASNTALRFVENEQTPLLGVAVDIGTTTLAAYLYDLISGQKLAEASALNPQKHYGADVISRIEYALQGESARQDLQKDLSKGLNDLIASLCELAAKIQTQPADPQDILLITLAGNTTMMHLLTGLDPAGLAKAPFLPVSLAGQTIIAPTLGLNLSPNAQAVLLPSIASYVGADITAGILAGQLDKKRKRENRLLLDIGTNGEIVLASPAGLVACATAAGPAFEGANITYGMPAQVGAIDLAIWSDHRLKMRIIGPMWTTVRGICGTGLVALVAALLDAGVIDETGRLCNPDEADYLPKELSERLVDLDGHTAFRLTPESQEEPVFLTQRDVRELQNAKAAIAAGIEILLKHEGLDFKDLDRIDLAGGFGSLINVTQAIRIGLLPESVKNIVRTVGNSCAAGAAECLLKAKQIRRAAKIARKVHYFELSSNPQFSDLYIDAMMFPEPEDDDYEDEPGHVHDENCNHGHDHGHSHEHVHDEHCNHDHDHDHGHKHH